MSKLRVLELFSGIGACSKALEKLGIEHEIVDAVEIDKYAVKSFNTIHNTNFEPQDIRTWDKDIEVDLIMHGSPCQDFSLAGKQAGGDKDSGTRSSLMYETIRIVEKLKPKYVIWENVKNLLSKKHRHNFDAYLETMEQLGYTNYYQVLNAKDYGIPQNRERVFTVSIRDDSCYAMYEGEEYYEDYSCNFEFPPKQELNTNWFDFVGDCSIEYIKVNKTPSRDKMREKCKNITKQQCCNTITLKQDRYPNAGIIDFDGYYRFLTPMEQWLLMGFDKEDYLKSKNVQKGNLQLQKQAGNSICVPVLEAIFDILLIDYK